MTTPQAAQPKRQAQLDTIFIPGTTEMCLFECVNRLLLTRSGTRATECVCPKNEIDCLESLLK